MDRVTGIQKGKGDLYCRKDRKVLMWIRRFKKKSIIINWQWLEKIDIDKREIDLDKDDGRDKKGLTWIGGR